MGSDIFVDTSGFYALLVGGDDRHLAADQVVRDARSRKRGFVTTDYVLDETATLLKARRLGHVLPEWFQTIQKSQACRIEWTDAGRFFAVQAFFLKHADQPWSFTDCLSFWLMKHLRLKDALSKDEHFRIAGFRALLT
jgi:predicted nucleic acid-binding protein